MAICPKCGMSIFYAETHVCAGRDKSKLWLMGAVAIGALAGAPLGRSFAYYLIRLACNRPNAGNVCGLFVAPMVPVWIIAGAVAGASVTVAAVTIILGRRAP